MTNNKLEYSKFSIITNKIEIPGIIGILILVKKKRNLIWILIKECDLWIYKYWLLAVTNFSDDISVRFVEQDEDGNVLWEAFGNFGPFDVHRQVTFKFNSISFT